MARDDGDRTIVATEGGGGLPVLELLTGRGFITGKSGSGKSILGGTPVYTESGREPIERVEEGDRVLSLNKRTFEQEFREVQATISHETSDLLRVTLEDGTELVGTADHSFLTADGMEIVPIPGSDVREGTWMPLARELPTSVRHTEIDLGEYAPDVNNVVVDTDEIRSAGKRGERFLPLDAGAGRVLGLYLAEGSFDSKMTVQISATDPSVRSFLDTQEFAVYEKTCNRSFSPFARFLEAEFGRGAGEKRIPEWVFDAPEPFRAGLLGGYVDGDGTVNDDTIAATSKSKPLLDGISELLRQFGISTTLKEKLVLYGDESRAYHRLTVDSFHVERFAGAVELLIEGKREKAARIAEEGGRGEGHNSKDMIPNFGPVLNHAARERGLNERSGGQRADASSVHLLTRRQKAGRETYNRIVDELDVEGRAAAYGRSDVQWKRVVSVEPVEGPRTVYDLDVELNDNFVADGVFVHNSNTASVVAEGLLAEGVNLLVVDTEGEYFGLKEEFEVLHVGVDEFCDVQVTLGEAERIAEVALVEDVPVVLDVSGYIDGAEAKELIHDVVAHLFAKAKRERKPFLLVVEEIQEYLPQKGGASDLAKLLERVTKRGRKRGLGICGVSQRPSSVDKDFITQCDWLVWHRLTWKNDVSMARDVLGSERADTIQHFDAGEAFLLTDWDGSIERVRFRRKATRDAGATPGLDAYGRDEGTVRDAATDVRGFDPAEASGTGAETTVGGGDFSTEGGGDAASRTADAERTVAAVERDGNSRADQRRLDTADGTDREDLSERDRGDSLDDEVAAIRSDAATAGSARRARRPQRGRGTARARGEGADRLARPEAPSPAAAPEERAGVGGTLAEFGDFSSYLLRSLAYRVRLGVYRARRALRERDG
jgi:intein/homing endonuclease